MRCDADRDAVHKLRRGQDHSMRGHFKEEEKDDSQTWGGADCQP